MKFSCVIVLLFVPILLIGQDIFMKNAESYQPERVSAFLHKLHDANDYVISFRLKLTDSNDEKSDYFILAREGENLSAYNYLKATKTLEPLKLSTELLELAWKTFIQNDLFTMQNEKDISNFCLGKYQIYNSYTYEFVLLNKATMKKLSYYNPEYYDNACYGMEERKKIITSVSVINYVLRR